MDNVLLYHALKNGILIDVSLAFPHIHQGRSSHRNVPRVDDNYNVEYLTHKGVLADSRYQVLRYGGNLILLSCSVSFNHVASPSFKMKEGSVILFLNLVSLFILKCNIRLLL